MSYDLYFFKRKEHLLSEQEIGNYLTKNLTPAIEGGNQWFFENEDTEVYYSFDQNPPEDEPEAIEMLESFTDFDNTHFTFNLNFLRPNFFGLEAFSFVEKFITDLDLFVLDPQSKTDPDNPKKISGNEMIETWSATNLGQSVIQYNELGLTYIPLDKSNDIWNYNFQRRKIQANLGDSYFVPKLFIMRVKGTERIITLSTWTQHIPIVLPPADYFLISKEYKKLFRTVKGNGLISYDTLINNCGEYFDDFDFNDCKIIHPDKAIKVKDIFNGLKMEYIAGTFCERMSMDKLVNAKP